MEAKGLHQQRHKKSSSLFICFVLILNMIFSITPVYAAGETIVLKHPDEGANLPFTATSMLPGDEISQNYVLNILHRENVEVQFRAKVHLGFEKLAEVLKLKITIDGVEKYNGLMIDTPEFVTHILPAGQPSLTYGLTVYLDTSVGNDYQNKKLKADFEWRYIPESQGGGGGAGGGGEKPPVDPGNTKLLRRAYVIGRPYDLFEPESPITRAEVATIFARIFADYDEENLISTETSFKDVEATEWYAKYISRCEDENIIYGYEDNFRPSENITRAELAAMCVRFYERRSGSNIPPKDISFTDFDSSHWAYDSIKKAYANGYVTGYPDGSLKADNVISRAETVTIVNRMLERIPDKEYIDNNLHKLIDFIDVRDNTYWAYYEIFEAANTHYIRFINDFAKWVD